MKVTTLLILLLISVCALVTSTKLRSPSYVPLHHDEAGSIHKPDVGLSKEEILNDAWNAVEHSEKYGELLGTTKARVSAQPMEVVLPKKPSVREVDYAPIEKQLKANLNVMEALAHYVNVLVKGSKYQPAPDTKIVKADNMKQYYKLAKLSEQMLFKCNKVLKDIDHTRTFDNHNAFVAKWVVDESSNKVVVITEEETNSAKQVILKRSTVKELQGVKVDSAKSAMMKVHYEADMHRGNLVQLAYDMCVAGGHKVDIPNEHVEASNPQHLSALKALEETMKLFVLTKKSKPFLDLKEEIQMEKAMLKERTKDWIAHKKVNDKEAHEQYLDRVELDDDMEQLAKRKSFNLVKITQRLNRLHVERGRPCSGTRCETLRRVVGALRRAKKALSDADVCDAARTCEECSKMSFCGWCDTEKTCLEGNVVRPRFGPSCSGGWIHQQSEDAKCPATDGKAPVTPVKYPDPSIFFDPECAGFNGTPGDCARAKLRLIAIEHMCLAKGGTKEECEKEKELEAAKISIEQVQQQKEKEGTLKALKKQEEGGKRIEQAENLKKYNINLQKCKEIHAKQQRSHPRFVECGRFIQSNMKNSIATSLLQVSELTFTATGSSSSSSSSSSSATGAKGTIGSATKAATGAAKKAATGADNEVITEDMKAAEEEQAKKDAAKEKEEKEENAKLNGDDDALIKSQEAKAKQAEGPVGVTGSTGSTGATGAAATGPSSNLASKATGPSSVTGGSIGKAATGFEHADSLGTEEKAVDPDDEEEDRLKKKNLATIIGDGMGPNGKASLTATISVEMKMTGINKKEFEDNSPAFTAAVAVAWGGDKNLASMVQILDLKQGLGVDNGVASPASADSFLLLQLGSASTGPASEPSLDDPMGDDTVVSNPKTLPSLSFKVLFQLVGANARKKALQIAERAGGEKGGSTLASQLPDSLSKATLKVTSRPKVTVGNTESTKARNIVSLDAATRKAQEALARHTVKALEGAMWSHHRPHADPQVQKLYRKRFDCRDDNCLKKLDDQISAIRRMSADAVDTEQVE